MHPVIRELLALSRMRSDRLSSAIAMLRGEELRAAVWALPLGQDGAANVYERDRYRFVAVNGRKIAEAPPGPDELGVAIVPWVGAEALRAQARAASRHAHLGREVDRREVDAAFSGVHGIVYTPGQEGGFFRASSGRGVSARGVLTRAGLGAALDLLPGWDDRGADNDRLLALGIEVLDYEALSWSTDFQIRVRDARSDLAQRIEKPHRAPRTHAERREAEAW